MAAVVRDDLLPARPLASTAGSRSALWFSSWPGPERSWRSVSSARHGRDDDLLSGIAGGSVDPDSISNETLEAVIAANLDNPEIGGMRLALANRYFEERNYQKAFPHYQAVLDGTPTPIQAAEAYTRLGWMVYDGNGEVDLGLSLIDNALEIAPGDPFALYLKGRVLWCGQGDNEGAAVALHRGAGLVGPRR